MCNDEVSCSSIEEFQRELILWNTRSVEIWLATTYVHTKRVPGKPCLPYMLVCPLVFRERYTRGKLVCPSCSLSSGTLRGVPGECQGKACLYSVWYPERGARGRLVCPSCSLSSGTPKGVPREGLSVLHVVCPLVFREGCQGKACLS